MTREALSLDAITGISTRSSTIIRSARRRRHHRNLSTRTPRDEYRRILGDSVFSICPGGTGPTASVFGSQSDSGRFQSFWRTPISHPALLPFGKRRRCGARNHRTLYGGLPTGSIPCDRNLPAGTKKEGWREIWALYGPDTFIYDLQCRTVDLHAEARDSERSGTKLSRSLWLQLAATILREPESPRSQL